MIMSDVSRGTKAFSQRSQSGYPGSFPVGFLKWVQDRWWGDRRLYLCAGGVIDEAADKVDIQTEISDEVLGRRGHNATTKRSRTLKTTANIIADARDTGLPDNSYDWVMIDPPYSKSLAHDLYGTEEVFSDLNKFVDEGARLCKPGGYVCVLAYDIPKIPQGFEIAAVWGIYQIPAVRYMTAFFVFKKWGEREAQGLQRFGV